METMDHNIHEHMARLRVKMMQKKLEKAQERTTRVSTANSDNVRRNVDNQLKLQQAVLRRQELLDKIRAENEAYTRPKSDRGRKKEKRSFSRLSLPDFNTRHVIEHQVKPVSPVPPRLRPLDRTPPPPPPAPQPIIQPVPYPTVQQFQMPENNVNRSFNKSDFMEMMMMQSTQMNQLIMQQMMMASLPGNKPSPQLTVPLGYFQPPLPPPPPPPIETRERRHTPQILTLKAPHRPGSVHHHHYTIAGQPPPPPPPPQVAPQNTVVHHVTQLPPLEMKPPRPPSTPSSKTLPIEVPPMIQPKVRLKPASKPPTPIIHIPTPTPPPPKPVYKPKYAFPGPRLLRKLRHIFYAAWFIAFLKAEMRKNKTNKPNEKFLFGIQLKEAVAALHRIYLNPDGNIYPILSEIVGEGAFDLFIEDTKGRRKSTEEDKQALQELTYVVENLTYYITDIMPETGVLGTHRKAAVFELIKNGKEFPNGYFWQLERDMLEFDADNKTKNNNVERAIILLIGVFISRSLVTTLLMKPLDYGFSTTLLDDLGEKNLKLLATIMIYIVRRVSVPRKQTPWPMPYEISKYLYTDEEMKFIFTKIKKSIEYSENLLRDWADEFVKRLMAAGTTGITVK